MDRDRAADRYTSGANNYTAAMTGIFARFFGRDDMTFSVTTTNPGPTTQDTRTYQRFSDAAQEVVDARVYEGIHFRFADEAARKQGTQVASWAFSNFLRPIEKPGEGCHFAHRGTSGSASLAPLGLLMLGLVGALRRRRPRL